MNLNFNDKSLLLTYIQLKLKETYNPNININGIYYETFNNNYGMAHFIAKYLDYMYPMPQEIKDLQNNNTNPDICTLTNGFSIMQYFLADNNGNILKYSSDSNNIFTKIYIVEGKDTENKESKIKICDNHDTPIITDPNTTFKPLETWSTDKQICEIDDFIFSFLIGRTITPRSSLESIYYVQKLLIHEDIDVVNRGSWFSPQGNLTELLINYQQEHLNPYAIHPLFVTGYFDIFTEAELLRDRGEQSYGITAL